jgi:hypothetical protein
VATAIGLTKDVQGDFSGGSFPTFPRDEIPESALEDALNCLIDDNGLPYLRGGSSFVSVAIPAALGTGGRWIYDGYFAPGQRTFIITDVSGTAGLYCPAISTTSVALAPEFVRITGRKAAQLGNVLYLPGGFVYGGEVGLVGVAISGGTITLTQGSTTVLGAGTTWTDPSGFAPGRLLFVDSLGAELVIASLTDGTHLELAEPWTDATAAGLSYSTTNLSSWPALSGAQYQSLNGFYVFGAVGDRLLAASDGGTPATPAVKVPQNRVYMSDRRKPRSVLNTNYWDLPRGVTVVGIEAYRDTAIILASQGIWAIYNVSLDLTDAAGNPQQRFEQITRDLIPWYWSGVANYGGGLIIPCLDGIYSFNPTTGSQEIGKPIKPLYLSYVNAGHIPGHAQFVNGHYVLPITDSSGAPVDLLTCRLSPTRQGIGGQWTRQASPMRFTSTSVKSVAGGLSELHGLYPSTARSVKCAWWDLPSGTPITDYDATNPQATITTREFRLNSVKNFLSYVKARYELAGTGVSLSAAAGVDGAGTTALTGTGAAGTIANPKVWQVGKRGYGIRLVLTTAGQVSKFALHSLEAFLRPSGRST